MLINEKYLKNFSPIPLNFSMDEVMPYVPYCEDIWIKPIVGEYLFDELQEQIENDEVSDENATLLLEALWPYEAMATVMEALPFIWAHVSQVGITLGKSDNSDSVTLKDLTLIQNHLRSQVEARKDYLFKWLCDRAESFPLFPTDKCSCSCSCACGNNANGKLNTPNKYSQLYSTPRINTDIK